MREKVVASVFGIDTSMAGMLPAFLSLLDLETDDEQWLRLDPSQRRQRINEAVKHLLVQESRLRSVLLVLEDVHWIDRETEALLNALVEGVADCRIALVVNYRPEYVDPWVGDANYATDRC